MEQVGEYLLLCVAGAEKTVEDAVCRALVGQEGNVVECLQYLSPDTGEPRPGLAGSGKLLLRTSASLESLNRVRVVERVFWFLGQSKNVPETDGGWSRGSLVRAVNRVLRCTSGRWQRGLDWLGLSLEQHGSFRVTVLRDGNHPFRSPDAAAWIGSEVAALLGDHWVVSLKRGEFSLEVVTFLDNEDLVLGFNPNPNVNWIHEALRLPLSSPSTRGFSLRQSTGAVLVELASVQPGEIVVDNMCGRGTIAIEGALAHSSAVFFGGDIEEDVLVNEFSPAARHPILINGGAKIEVAQWDTERLPLRDASVDCFIVDLPFGVRCGNWKEARRLLRATLSEMHRTLRGGKRALVLTVSRKHFKQELDSKSWALYHCQPLNVGGMSVFLFHLVKLSE